ncbi:MAG: MmcQ/YjbR family DNA-binding protein [Planctomycetes bacterium]|nr:MmcQ/YjbR family DNA-binding protein [Planctomycetota bacterium]
MARPRELGEALLRFGLSLPGAREDHPWGELVLKAGAKVFVFLGKPADALCFSVKLPRSGERLLDQDWAEPTGYGLGKSGWLTLSIEPNCPLGERELCALLEESYRAVAPKKLVQELDAASATPAKKRHAPRRKA